ncbi:MAG: hypothetical protein OK457_10080, partial [Thaumarchaeota archaeon]|nr:hypothetical protein [Nitrososphaerota archaeon]
EYFKAAGLGRFNFIVSQEKSIQTTVLDPSLSDTGEAIGNHFLHGVIVGLIEGLENRSMMVVEDLYDVKARRLSFHLVEKEISKQTASEPVLKPSLPKEVQAQALDEVEKVIKSLEKEGPDLDDRTPLLIEIGAERSALAAKVQAPVQSSTPSIYTPKEPSLNKLLKAYKDGGWVGGKVIGTTPESEKSTALVVVKYTEPEKKIDLPSSLVEPISNSEKGEKKEELVEKIDSSIESPRELQDSSVKIPAKRNVRQDEDDADLYNQELRDSDDLFFEDSF